MGVALCDVFSHEQCEVIIYTRIACAALSLIGCATILFSIWLYRKQRNFAQRLVMWLTVAATFDSIPYFFGTQHPPNDAFCDIQAFWVSVFDWVVLLWICALTFYLHMLIIQGRDTARYERGYHLIVWGLPLIPAVIPLAFQAYAPAGAWCWIVETQVLMRFVLWYIPMLILLIGIGISYAMMYRRLRYDTMIFKGSHENAVQEEFESHEENIRTLRWYPVVYVVLAIFSIINRIQNAVHPSRPIFALYLLHSFSSPLQGVFNAFVYLTNVATWTSCNFRSIKKALFHRLSSPEMEEYTVQSSKTSREDDAELLETSSSDDEKDISELS
eukprot:gene7733-7731_t